MNPLKDAAIRLNKLHNLLCVPDGTISQQIYVRSLAIRRLPFSEDICQRLINLRSSKVSGELRYLRDSKLHVFIVVIYAALREHKLVA